MSDGGRENQFENGQMDTSTAKEANMPVALKEIVVDGFKGQNEGGKEMKRTRKLERVIVTLAILLGSVLVAVLIYFSVTYEIANGTKTAPVKTTDTPANGPLVRSGTENKTRISDPLSPTGKIPTTESIQTTRVTPTTTFFNRVVPVPLEIDEPVSPLTTIATTTTTTASNLLSTSTVPATRRLVATRAPSVTTTTTFFNRGAPVPPEINVCVDSVSSTTTVCVDSVSSTTTVDPVSSTTTTTSSTTTPKTTTFSVLSTSTVSPLGSTVVVPSIRRVIATRAPSVASTTIATKVLSTSTGLIIESNPASQRASIITPQDTSTTATPGSDNLAKQATYNSVTQSASNSTAETNSTPSGQTMDDQASHPTSNTAV